jgi:ribosomal 30S subunit maturation factor RimM
LGAITEAYTGGANDAIEVQRPDASTFLLPLIEELVVRVDWDNGAVVVRDITPYVVTDED